MSKNRFKIDLIVFLIKNRLIGIGFDNNNIQQLISDYSDIEKILQIDDKSILLKIIYFNKNIIHYILYDTENIININYYFQKLVCYFYLDLLILENPYIINYNYPINFISNILYVNNKKKEKYKIVSYFISRNVINFINNYKETYLHNKKEDEYLNKIKNNALDVIKNDISIFKDLGMELITEKDVLTKKIDELYISIIVSLLKNKKFKNYEYIYDIFEQLDLENIDINQYMFEELYKIMNEEEYIKPYLVTNIHDLIDINKINFYFIILKFIFKNSIYIYQIPILLKTKIIIIKIIKNKNKLKELCDLQVNENLKAIIIERMNYIIKKLVDSEYYYKIYLKDLITSYLNTLKQILHYYETFLFESKKNDINIIKKIIEKEQIENYDIYLNDYEKAYKINNREKIIFYLFDLNLKNEKIKENELNKYIYEWNLLEEMIKNKKYKKIKYDYKIKLIQFFKEQKNENIILKIFKENEYKLFIKENISLLQKKNEEKTKINNDKTITENIIIKKGLDIEIIKDKKNVNSINKLNSNIYKKSSINEIISYVKEIGDHNNEYSEIIKNVGHDHYISSGTNNKLLLYNKLFEIKLKIETDDWVYDIYELNSEKSNEKIEINLVISCGKEVILITIDTTNYKYETQRFIISYTKSFHQIGDNEYILLTDKGVYDIMDLFDYNAKNMNCEKIINQVYRNGIPITNNIFAFIPNNKSSYSENNKLILYNITTKKKITSINDYSFILTSNGLCLLSTNEKLSINNKILLCACKKYNQKQKNGILLVNIDLKNKDNFCEYFYDTEYFEVFCFCQIYNVQNEKENEINDDTNLFENIMEETDYVLVGGYDEEKMEGIIKLFKILFSEKYNEIKLDYIQDITIEKNEKFEGFGNAVSCITQSKTTGNIITTCWDGKVQLFNPPNIDFF